MEAESLLGSILPPSVAVAAIRVDPPGILLFPGEQRAIARAVPKRRNEFATVRLCARRALARLGTSPVPLVPGPRGAPRWPEGIVGSLTHCIGFRAAAVARATQWCAVGIDAEPHHRLTPDVLETIALASELQRVRTLLRVRPAVCWDRLLFCLKEAVYKAWYPLTLRSLGFEGACIELDAERGAFEARIRSARSARDEGGRIGDPQGLCRMRGRWCIDQGLIVCAVTVPGPVRSV